MNLFKTYNRIWNQQDNYPPINMNSPSFTITRPLTILDVETTGTEVTQDAIFWFSAIRFNPGSIPLSFNFKIKPWKEVPAEVEELTGVTNKELADCPPFSFHALHIAQILGDTDYAGFNLRRFDLPIIQEELSRCGIDWDPMAGNIIDSGTIFQLKEPRSLKAAAMFYANHDMGDENHDAMKDVEATLKVLNGQLVKYPDLKALDLPALARFSQHEDYIDLSGKLARDKDGDAVYTFGKSKGVKVKDDPGFGGWMMNKDFPLNTKNALRKIFDEINGQNSLF